MTVVNSIQIGLSPISIVYAEKNGVMYRGVVVALSKDGKRAIIKGYSRRGLILIAEKTSYWYPVVVKAVNGIQTGFETV